MIEAQYWYSGHEHNKCPKCQTNSARKLDTAVPLLAAKEKSQLFIKGAF